MAKKDFQKEMSKLMVQMKKNLKKFGKDASVFAKKGEKELVKASKIGRLQIDIVSLNLQKEKIYRDMGKKVASLRSSKGLNGNVVKIYLQKLRKIEVSIRNRKREISMIKKGESQNR